MNKTRGDKTFLQTVIRIVAVLTALAIVVLGGLEIFEIWEPVIDINLLLNGIFMLCLTYFMWNTSRKVAYFSLGVSVLSFVVFAVFLFI